MQKPATLPMGSYTINMVFRADGVDFLSKEKDQTTLLEGTLRVMAANYAEFRLERCSNKYYGIYKEKEGCFELKSEEGDIKSKLLLHLIKDCPGKFYGTWLDCLSGDGTFTINIINGSYTKCKLEIENKIMAANCKKCLDLQYYHCPECAIGISHESCYDGWVKCSCNKNKN